MPFVFYEILELATQNKAREIVPLIESVIAVTLANPGSLTTLRGDSNSGDG